MFETSAPKAIVYSSDNDAGRAIQTAQLTRWYNSNHFGPYGNLYFRFAHTIAAFSPDLHDKEFSSIENDERKHHFALQLTSLFSLLVLCGLLSFILTQDWIATLLLGNVLFHLSIQDGTWPFLIFKAHPDHLLMLATAAAGYFTIHYSKDKTEKNFILAALMWGVATAVKRATVLFIPSFLFLFLSEGLNRESLKKGFQFIGYMLLAYLVVGFPQNFGFYKHIKFMLAESQNSRPPTLESVTEYFSLIFNQTKYILLAFLPIHLLFGKRERIITWRMLVFSLLTLLMVISNRMVTPHYHHAMPFIGCFLVTMIYVIKLLPVLDFKYKTAALFVISLTALYFLRDLPTAFLEQRDHQLICRPEAFKLLAMIKEEQKTSGIILGREPYFPFDSSKEGLSKQYWGASMQDFDRDNVSLFGTKRSFGEQFLKDGPEYNMLEKANNWKDKQDLYRRVLTEDQFTTPVGHTYKKIHEDSCGFQLWKRF